MAQSRSDSYKSRLTKAMMLLSVTPTEAVIMAALLVRESLPAEDLAEEAGLSRGTAYSSLGSLVSRGLVMKEGHRPVRYSATPSALSTVRGELQQLISLVQTERLSPRREGILSKITVLLERQGYAIRDISPRQGRVSIIDKVADGEFSIGLAVLDRNKTGLTRYPESIMADILESATYRATVELGCLTSFIFLDESVSPFRRLWRELKREDRRSHFISRRERIGIPTKPYYLFEVDHAEEGTLSAINDIKSRKNVASEASSRLRERIDKIQQMIRLSQGHVVSIDEMIKGEEPPYSEDPVKRRMSLIVDAVQNIRGREARNLEIFRNKFGELEVGIREYLEAFEQGIYIPPVTQTDPDLRELDALLGKFEPIEFELSTLSDEVFEYAVAHRGGLNPFMFTEPYEPKLFYADQKRMEKMALGLVRELTQGNSTCFRFISGQAGAGKTHSLKYIVQPLLQRKGFITVYVDCPLRYDLIAAVFPETVQDGLYPPGMRQSVKELRHSSIETAKQFSAALRILRDQAWAQGYAGLVILVDELENLVPYPYRSVSGDRRPRTYTPPLAFRQMRDLLRSGSTKGLGIVVSFRSAVLPIFRDTIEMANFDAFLTEPESLSIDDLSALVASRYDTWRIRRAPTFTRDALAKIAKLAESNTRDTIRWCRTLYDTAQRRRIKRITVETVKKTQPIPVFRY